MPLTRKRFLGLAGRGALGAAAYTTFGFLDRAEAGDCSTQPPILPFNYVGTAIGVRGTITDPARLGEIPPQAVTKLKPGGGRGRAVIPPGGFDFEVFSVNDGYSEVTGNPDLKDCKPVFRTVVTSVLMGVEIDGVIRATSIVAVLESQQPEVEPPEKRVRDRNYCKNYPKDCELEMAPVGYFDSLTIRGYPVKLGRSDMLKSLVQPTGQPTKWSQKQAIDDELLKVEREIEPNIRKEEEQSGDKSLRTRLCRDKHDGTAGLVGVWSIFSDWKMLMAFRDVPDVKVCKGGRVHIKDLGDIILGRFEFKEHLRRLTMLRVEFNSPPRGDVDMASVEGDGSPS